MSAPKALQATVRDLEMLRDVAVAAATGAANIVRSLRGAGATVEGQTKGRGDYVSIVDTPAQKRIREIVARAVPDARVIGEELSPGDSAGTGISFLVDPLDGTTNFLHDYPEYAVSVAVLVDRETVVGTVVNVPTHSSWVAVAGQGATVDGRPIHVSEVREPGRALIGTGFPFKY